MFLSWVVDGDPQSLEGYGSSWLLAKRREAFLCRYAAAEEVQCPGSNRVREKLTDIPQEIVNPPLQNAKQTKCQHPYPPRKLQWESPFCRRWSPSCWPCLLSNSRTFKINLILLWYFYVGDASLQNNFSSLITSVEIYQNIHWNGACIPPYFEMCVENDLFYLWYVFETVSYSWCCVMLLPHSFISFLEETCLHNCLGTSLLAVFLSGYCWGRMCFQHQGLLSVFYVLPAVSDCCFIMAFFPKPSLQ